MSEQGFFSRLPLPEPGAKINELRVWFHKRWQERIDFHRQALAAPLTLPEATRREHRACLAQAEKQAAAWFLKIGKP